MSEYKGRQLEGANFHIFAPESPQPSPHRAEDKACAAGDPRLATAPRDRSSSRRDGSPSPRTRGSPTWSSTKSQSRGSRRRPPSVPLGRCPIVARPGTREGRQRQRVPVALTMTSPGWQPQTPGARASPGGRMSPGRSPCASGWITLLFCARVRRERARSRRCFNGSGWRGWGWQWARLCATDSGCHARKGSAWGGSGSGSAGRQAALSGPLATGVFSLPARNSESADLGSSHQGLPASHC